MNDLTRIKTIVLVMMENRSFDHMLGYLSLPPFKRPGVDGQSLDPAWLAKFTNSDNGHPFHPFLSTNPYTMPDDFDPPHERNAVAANLGALTGGSYAMNGFMSGIPSTVSSDPAVRKLVMSYFGAEQAPTNHFFAQNFAICNRYFCSLPAGTHPNRLMSLSGFSEIDVNATVLPAQPVIYDWLNDRGVTWRVYHEGIPLLALMPNWIPPILADDEHFRSFEQLGEDLLNTPPDDLPQVIFVEPTYQDAPHFGPASDDHAPAGISTGQEFLMQVYNALTASPSVWQQSAMIVNYDEHGGFFDHVSPPLIPTDPPAGSTYPRFTSLGVRTPAFVISPFVKAGTVSQELLDHLSVLKFLGERFDANRSHSTMVDARPVKSISAVFNLDHPRTDVPAAPSLQGFIARRPPPPPGLVAPPPDTEMRQGFRDAVERMKQHGATADHPKFGPLIRAMR